MLCFAVKSLLNSANPSGISRYKIRKNNPLHFQHLRHPLASAHSKGTSTPLDSAVTRPLSLTPAESTLTKIRGRGVGAVLVSLTKNSRNFVYPERLSREGPHSLPLFAKSETHLPSFQHLLHSLPKTTGVYPQYSLPRRLSPRGQNGPAAARLWQPPPGGPDVLYIGISFRAARFARDFRQSIGGWTKPGFAAR